MLELADVHAGYGKTTVLRGVSLAVGAGEIVTIIGSNGAGKSTILRTVSGLVPARRGQIRFKGKPLGAKASAVVRAGISQVPEGRRLFADMTVHENLLLGAYTCAKAELPARLAQVYDVFPKLRERSTQAAGSLSGGEQQMVAIGRGLIARPSLLMLDEPSMGLAPKMVMQVAEIIKSIRELGISILLVEQNARIALELADRAFVLQTGTIVKEGPAAALRDDPFIRRAYLGL
ncbi:MAG: ABC transporter ATP-binding protein [Hyphomicrobiaceae bacterium]|nr:ABC transporter ATP-binding protein [Hyphomicrobiaceae bacterium]